MLLLGAAASCDDGPAPPRPESLAVTPSSVTLTSLGDTAVVSASIADQYGDAFAGAVRWTSSRPSVFTVTAAGVVEAVANGSGVVTASFQELSATAGVTVAQAPSSVDVMSGDEQVVRQGLALYEDVVVRVGDAGGSPVQGVTVAFAPADGDGAADPATATTDADGLARTSWTLGDHAGPQSLAASVGGGGDVSVQLSATALTPEEATDSLRIADGDAQVGIQGRPLRNALAVLALDGRGEPVPGVRIAFAPADGDGSADPDTATTDADGLAQTSWTLGDHAGAQSFAASVDIDGGPSTQLSATALTPEEATDSLRIADGNAQVGIRGWALRTPLAVLALDSRGEPVPGVRVAFAPADGDGAADPDTATTDAEGLARTSWTLGDHAGAQSLAAAVAVDGGPSVQLSATALTPEEATDSLRVADGDAQVGIQGWALRTPLAVLALDGRGEPVPGVRVAFAPADGDGSADPDTATTDAEGLARTSWTLGDHAGAQSLAAAVAVDGGPSVQLSATGLTPEEAIDSLRVADGDRQSGLQGRALPAPVTLLALGSRGEPVPGVRVAFAPADGDGSADPDTATTDAEGLARTSWTLGDHAGAQSLAAAVAVDGGPSAQLFATALTPEEATNSLSIWRGNRQSGLPEAGLRRPVVVAALDAHGRPVPGVDVSFAPAPGHGTADPSSAVTDSEGRAQTSWTLGASLGTQRLTATAAGHAAQATATALTPEEAVAAIRVVSGDEQRALRATALPSPVVVAALDAGGGPVPGVDVSFAPAPGHGSADPSSAVTDSEGRAQTSWTLGASLGAQSLTATAVGFSVDAAAEATGTPPVRPEVHVEAAYLVQAAQDMDGSVPLVAGRQARLRVFARGADGADTVQFRPLALFYRGATIDSVWMETGSVPAAVDEGDESKSFDATIPGSVVQSGLQMVVEVNPGGRVALASGSAARYPRSGRASVAVHQLSRFDLTLVPIHFGRTVNNGRATTITALAAEIAGTDTSGVISYTRNILPIGNIRVTTRQPYVTWADTSQNGLHTLLSELGTLRQTHGPSEYYHGFVARPSTAANTNRWGWAGIAMRPGPASLTVTHAADGSGSLTAWGVAATMAHELGHNLGLRHTPCGYPSNVDPDFPHSDGSVGVHGYSFSTAFVSGLVTPGGHYDLMSYCDPEWTSGYSFTKALNYRSRWGYLRASGAVGGPALPDAHGATLLLWGSILDGHMDLGPAFVVEGPVKLPESEGPYRLEGLANNGERVFGFAFSPDPVDHGGGTVFLFALPFEEAWTQDLDRIELAGPEGTTVLDREAGARAAMLIDGTTGQVRSIVRDVSGAAAAAFGPGAPMVIRRGFPR